MSCPEIKSLTFSADGERAIHAIVAKQNLGNLLAGLIATSQIIEIFSGGGTAPFGMARNIAKSDWVAWADAMKKSTDLTRGSIMRDAGHQAQITSDSKEREFWTAVHYGCQ
jgi:hypothetical protein